MSRFIKPQWADASRTVVQVGEGSNRFTFIPADPDNSDYAELMKLVEAGELEILDNSGGE